MDLTDLPLSWHVDRLLHNLPNLQLTRVGDYYPFHKVQALDALHAAARDTPPFALSNLPLKDAQWHFFYPQKCAELQRNQQPLPISVIGIVDRIQLSGVGACITLYPFYANDAAKAKELFATWKDIAIDIDEECEEPPITLSIRTTAEKHNPGGTVNFQPIVAEV
ncbi:hypothetical protein OH77DRAFT_1434965 [Trametes cingulata]|nr:hypothetical protein OH77DRAFT_1434965 [Trametes cingulata]